MEHASRRIRSLEEIREYGRKWAALPTKTVRMIPKHDIWELFMAANHYVAEELMRYAKLYGFSNYSGQERAPVRCLRRCWGFCTKGNDIAIDFPYVLFADDASFKSTLLHELCHTEFHDHSDAFWKLHDQKLKEASIINKEGISDIYEGVSTIKINVIRRKICSDYAYGKIWGMRYSENDIVAELYRLVYEVSHNVYDHCCFGLTNPHRYYSRMREYIKRLFPEGIENLMSDRLGLIHVDYLDLIDFFKYKQIIEVYNESEEWDTGASDVVDAAVREMQSSQIKEPDILLILSAHSMKDDAFEDVWDTILEQSLEKIVSPSARLLYGLIENPELDEDVFCLRVILAGE